MFQCTLDGVFVARALDGLRSLDGVLALVPWIDGVLPLVPWMGLCPSFLGWGLAPETLVDEFLGLEVLVMFYDVLIVLKARVSWVA